MKFCRPSKLLFKYLSSVNCFLVWLRWRWTRILLNLLWCHHEGRIRLHHRSFGKLGLQPPWKYGLMTKTLSSPKELGWRPRRETVPRRNRISAQRALPPHKNTVLIMRLYIRGAANPIHLVTASQNICLSHLLDDAKCKYFYSIAYKYWG